MQSNKSMSTILSRERTAIGAPKLRHPRLRALAGGQILPGITSASVTSAAHYTADRFSLTARITSADAALWSDATSIPIALHFSLDAGQSWTELITGEADHLQIDPQHHHLTLDGRDLTARFIEARTQETFANRTASEIVTILAARHAMTANVTPTTTRVGTYWQLEHDHITLDSFARSTSEWELLIALAGLEGFDVWVRGSTLFFHPQTQTTGAIRLDRTDLTTIHLERALTLARDIEVTVKSWNSRQAKSFTQTAKATRGAGAKAGHGFIKPQRYVFIVPNLTPNQALSLAQTKLAELSRHERVITAEMPGELTLTPRQHIRLTGTDTGFDQDYWITDITRRLSQSHGFTQHLRAKNATVSPQATSPTEQIGRAWTAF